MPFCSECGANMPEGVKFCTSCGKAIAVSSAPRSMEVPPPQQPVYSQPHAPAPSSRGMSQPEPAAYNPSAPDVQPPTGQYSVVSTMSWLGTIILLAIPFIGLILCLVWAFGGGNLNRRNLSRAYLIILVAFLVLGIVFGVLMFLVLPSVAGPFMEQIQGAAGQLK